MAKEKMIQGTGKTCIFFHNSYLSQYVLEGKHPSSKSIKHSNYKKFSVNVPLRGINKVRSTKLEVGSKLEEWNASERVQVNERARGELSHVTEFTRSQVTELEETVEQMTKTGQKAPNLRTAGLGFENNVRPQI